ncbi:MAG TPA: PHP domain-containing protein, partial [Acidimicrobiales bacterium]|nr:PHP domain-containing protein [Acidimicrobiales bacterium]
MIDLHTHSTVSDGSEPPGRIVELAAAAGCTAMALTDHDSLAGVDEAGRVAAAVGVRLVPGCEVSCRKPAPPPGAPRIEGSVHVLVYFVEPGEGPLQEELVKLRGDRAVRNQELAARLVDLGTGVTYEDVLAEAGDEGGIGRPHFARALVKAGAAEDIDDAFDRWLA